jgi:hypothetical protein
MMKSTMLRFRPAARRASLGVVAQVPRALVKRPEVVTLMQRCSGWLPTAPARAALSPSTRANQSVKHCVDLFRFLSPLWSHGGSVEKWFRYQ